jgi:outer membrane protein assembly factor BamB
LDRVSGGIVWTREIEDDNPEVASSLTGHAAATPATDGKRVVAFFGNAGVISVDFDGRIQWRQRFGTFENELGLAASPVLDDRFIYLVCDHNGSRFHTFDSFVTALRLEDGSPAWKTDRPGHFRSWSSPLLVSRADVRLVVACGQGRVDAYNAQDGRHLGGFDGLADWIAPTPVESAGRLFVTCKNAPTVCLTTKAAGNEWRLTPVWQAAGGSSYVPSPVVIDDCLWVLTENGVLSCRSTADGSLLGQERLEGKFYSSLVAASGRIYATNEGGTTTVLEARPDMKRMAANPLEETCLATPAPAHGMLYIRTAGALYAIQGE